MAGKRSKDEWTAEEAAFADEMERRAVAEGRLGQDAVLAAERLRRASVRAYRWHQQNRARTFACRAGGSGELAFQAFDEQFRPELDMAVGSMALGLLSFVAYLFFSGLRQWLISTVLRWIWAGAIDAFTKT